MESFAFFFFLSIFDGKSDASCDCWMYFLL